MKIRVCITYGRFEWNSRFMSSFQADFSGWWLRYLLWYCLQMNVIGQLTDDESKLVQIMAWCRQAASHYLSQCWPSSVLLYGISRPQWVNWNDISMTADGLVTSGAKASAGTILTQSVLIIFCTKWESLYHWIYTLNYQMFDTSHYTQNTFRMQTDRFEKKDVWILNIGSDKIL